MSNYIDECAFKKIKENSIILDFSEVKYLGEVHLILKEKLGLPEYYGENWDALWDCLSGLFYHEGNILVEIKAIDRLKEKFGDEYKLMLEVFDDVKKETPNFSYKIIS